MLFTASTILLNLALATAAVLPLESRTTTLASALGIKTGTNAVSATSSAWIGTGGAFTGDFINTSGETIELILWGPSASWVNVDTPLISYTLTSGSSVALSFAEGLSGAFSALYPSTTLVNGQVSNTWGEFTFSADYATFDVSREINMAGNKLSIVAEESCTSNMNTCVFQCLDGAETCWETYELANCAEGSQVGAMFGTYEGAASGGCLVGSTKKITATFS